MADHVFILGAGASADSGAPLMGNFLDKAEDLLRSPLQDIDRLAFQNVFDLIADLDSVNAKSSLDLSNIETLFGAIEMGRIIDKLGRRTGDDIAIAKQSLVKLIVQTLEKSIHYPVQDRTVLPTRSYQRLVKFISQLSDTSIITFNYDIALDFALHYENQHINYGLDKNSDGFSLLKLHGSLNWGRCTDCQRIVPYNLGDFFKDHSIFMHRELMGYDTVELSSTNSVMLQIGQRIRQQLTCEDGNCRSGLEDLPVIVPPTWNKTDYQGNLTAVWRKAAQHLATARNIYVIGYSLPDSDAFFRYLFALGVVGPSRLKRFWVFDPDTSGEIEARYMRLLGGSVKNRFRYFSWNLLTAVGNFENGLLNQA